MVLFITFVGTVVVSHENENKVLKSDCNPFLNNGFPWESAIVMEMCMLFMLRTLKVSKIRWFYKN